MRNLTIEEKERLQKNKEKLEEANKRWAEQQKELRKTVKGKQYGFSFMFNTLGYKSVDYGNGYRIMPADKNIEKNDITSYTKRIGIR